jgi:hypothetical protein
MALKLSSLREETQTAQITFMGEVIDFCYFPAKLTGETLDALDNAQVAGQFGTLFDKLSPVLAWVDVLDDDGKRIEPTPDNLRGWPVAFTMALMGQMAEEIRPPASRR